MRWFAHKCLVAGTVVAIAFSAIWLLSTFDARPVRAYEQSDYEAAVDDATEAQGETEAAMAAAADYEAVTIAMMDTCSELISNDPNVPWIVSDEFAAGEDAYWSGFTMFDEAHDSYTQSLQALLESHDWESMEMWTEATLAAGSAEELADHATAGFNAIQATSDWNDTDGYLDDENGYWKNARLHFENVMEYYNVNF